MNEFEEKMERQPVRQIPAGWREEILTAARAAQVVPQVTPVENRSFLSTLNHQLAALLWPHPKAWAGLAAVWVGILVLNLSMREQTPSLAEKVSVASPEVVVELQKQQKFYAELMGVNEVREADRPKVFTPSPRSGRSEILAG